MRKTSILEALGLVHVRTSPTEAPHESLASRIPQPAQATGVDAALSLESVYRAVNILQTFASQLTLDVYRNNEPIRRPLIISRPDMDLSLSAFLAETVAALALHGNAYWWIESDETGRALQAKNLTPTEVSISCERAPFSPRTYHYRGREYDSSKIIHLAICRIPGRLYGLGALQANARGIAGALSVRTYGDTWLESGAVPSGILTSDNPLTADEARAYKNAWTSSVNAREVAVLGKGLKYEYLALTPSEVQWLDARKLSTVEIARLFGIPASLMLTNDSGSTLTYSNLQQDTQSFIRSTLMAYLREIEEAFTRLLPRGQTARFNLDAMLRPDTATRYDAYATALAAGFITLDEVRQTEGLAPLTESD